MADTQRTVTQILALLADNSTGQISPQDLRDALVSWRNGHGQIYVARGAAADITITNSNEWTECSEPVWTLSSGAHLFDESAGNGRLTYTGDQPMSAHIALSFSVSALTNNQLSNWGIAVNGTVHAAAELPRFISSASDVGAGAVHLITSMSNGDYLSMFAKNETSTGNLHVEAANLQVVTMIE